MVAPRPLDQGVVVEGEVGAHQEVEGEGAVLGVRPHQAAEDQPLGGEGEEGEGEGWRRLLMQHSQARQFLL